MARKNDGRPGMDVGLACPACGVPSTPDPEELTAVLRDARQWTHCFDRPKAAVALLWSRLVERRRPMHSLLSRD
jgi:hypothetical protein